MRQFQEYVEPDEPNEDRRRSGIKDEDKVLLPLDENVLTDNNGLPMIVVVTKVSWLKRNTPYVKYRLTFHFNACSGVQMETGEEFLNVCLTRNWSPSQERSH